MNLSGQLADWTMDDLLQIMHVTKKTGSLDIVGTRKGRVHFRDGKVTAAELHSSRGVYAGTDPAIIADVVFVLGSMSEGTFTMGAADGPDVDGIDIELVSTKVGELRELESTVADEGLIGTGEVVLTPTIPEDITITPDDWASIASLVQPFTFQGLEDRLGRGAAIRMVHAFHRLGIAEAKEEGKEEVVDHGPGEVSEEESSWLDRLADEVSSTDSTKWLDEAVADVAEVPEDEPAAVAVKAEAKADAKADVRGEAAEEAAEDEDLEGKPFKSRGISAPASTTLTQGVYDDIRRLRSKVNE
ncbi:MAG: DUF4388 domain-containing protein [Actinobacteria bacterium]|nr:MAG: DUF4388 domain-containing protein [Actinomycetota bacterium]